MEDQVEQLNSEKMGSIVEYSIWSSTVDKPTGETIS